MSLKIALLKLFQFLPKANEFKLNLTLKVKVDCLTNNNN